jgi:hypothetical protein
MLPRVSSTNTVADVGTLPTTDVSDGDIRYVYNSTSGAIDTYVYYGTGWQKYLSGSSATLTACFGQYYKCSDITTTGLIAYYPLTGTADDWMGTYHGTEYTSVLYANDGTKGGVASFNGDDSGDYIDLNLASGIYGTLNYWMYVPTEITASSAMYIGNFNQTDQYNYIYAGDVTRSFDGETLSFLGYDKSQMFWYIKDTIPVGWHMVTTFWDGGAWKIYLDGVSKTVYTYNSQQIMAIDPIFGKTMSTTESSFNGKISNVRIYNRSLSYTEITTIYDTELIKHPIVVDSGLIAYYKLIRNSHDHNYNQYNGTDTSVTYDGKSATFNDSSSYISIDTNSVFNVSTTGSISISAWVKGSDFTGENHIFSTNSNSGTAYSYDLAISSNQPIVAHYDGTWASTDYTGTINDNQWHHLTGTIKNGGRLQLYLDGNSVSNVAARGSTNNIQTVTIGKRRDYYYGGSIANVRIYNKELTADDVKSIYNNEKGEVQ